MTDLLDRFKTALSDRYAIERELRSVGNRFHHSRPFILGLLGGVGLLLVAESQSQAQGPTARAERALQEGLQYYHQGTQEALERSLQLWQPALGELTAQTQAAAEVRGLLLVSVGNAHKMLGNRDSALHYFQRALPELRKARLRQIEALALILSGELYLQADQDSARYYLGRAATISRQEGDKAAEGRALAGLARVYAAHGRMDSALVLYKAALPMVSGAEGAVYVLEGISETYEQLGYLDSAGAYYRRMRQYQEPGDPPLSLRLLPQELGSVVAHPPERLSCPALQYPRAMQEARVEGEVVLEFVVDVQGRVVPYTVEVLRSTHVLFEPPAKAMIAGCVFRPATVDGRPVRLLVRQPVNFSIRLLRPR